MARSHRRGDPPLDGPVVLVGHSAGGYLLLKFLAGEPVARPIAALCTIAAPCPGASPEWTFDGFELPDDLADRLPQHAIVLLYASEDDEIVPFSHRDRYAAALPSATTRTTSGGHQLGRISQRSPTTSVRSRVRTDHEGRCWPAADAQDSKALVIRLRQLDQDLIEGREHYASFD